MTNPKVTIFWTVAPNDPDIVIGAISVIINGQTTDPAPAPHPMNSLPILRVQKFIIQFKIAPTRITRSISIKE